jgi:hypothetical protein
MARTYISDDRPEPREWSAGDLAALRRELKRGSSLVETARSLRRRPAEVANKIAELPAGPRAPVTPPDRNGAT